YSLKVYTLSILQESCCLADLAQILPHPVLDPRQCGGEVLQRVGDAEAEIAFSKCTERRAGEPGDSRFLKQRVGQFLRRPARLGDVRKHVKRTLRHAAGKPFDLVQPGNKSIASALELGAHFVDRRLVAAQRCDSGNLGETGGAGIRI